MADPPPAEDSPVAPASPLEQVVDDDTPRREALEWAADELYGDRNFDEVAALLIERGWDEDAAADIVEEARRLTREQRGVITREKFVRDADFYYRRATGRWFVGMPM